jgi:hypothetical protein
MIDATLVAALARAQGRELPQASAEAIAAGLAPNAERITKAGNAAPFEAEPASYVLAQLRGRRS